jgi:hypothetical protein
MLSTIKRNLCLLLVVSAIGCASAKVTPEATNSPASPVRPSQVVIYDFAVSPAEVTQILSALEHGDQHATDDHTLVV